MPHLEEAHCGGCGASLRGMRLDAKWCGGTCRSRARKDKDRRTWRERRSAWHGERGRWLRHGLDPEVWAAKLPAGCEACGAPFGSLADAQVDHDHTCCPGLTSCGECARGLLCRGCNAALGHVRDDTNRVVALLNYLERVTNDNAAA